MTESSAVLRCRIPLAIATLSLAASCGGSEDPRTNIQVSVADSAGVQIVVNPAAGDSAIALGQPELQIGVVAGEAAYEFHEIGPIAVDDHGEIYVGNGGSASVRVFDAEGRFLREFGRSGQGPGEFRSINAIWFAGDTVVVVDRRAFRASLFGRDGTFLTSWDLRLDDGRRLEPVARTARGILATARKQSRHFTAEPFVVFQDTSELTYFEPATRTAISALRYWPGERRIAAMEVFPVGPLFEPKPVVAVNSAGYQYQSLNGQYSIDVFDAEGKLVRRVRHEVPSIAITPTHFDQLRESLRSRTGEQASAVKRSAGYPTVSHFAIVGGILSAADGSFMVMRLDELDPIMLERGSGFGARDRAEHATAVAAVRWDVFDGAGSLVRSVRFPKRYSPRYFDGEAVYGVLEDDLGVQHVARYVVTEDR
jgi:hypothetical protein